ncbi:ribonuclease H-like domain-containing protein [Tanacetum coccineum]
MGEVNMNHRFPINLYVQNQLKTVIRDQPNFQNQNRGGNFSQNNQNQVYQAPPYQTPTNQPPINQVLPYQPPTNSVLKTDFENYVKANDAVLKNVQNQGQNLQNQMANVTSLLTSLCDNFKNSASTSNSGTLPSQTVTNPRQQINAITTRSGKALEEPSIPLVPSPDVSKPQKEPEQNPETSTEKVQNPNLENTAHVPPPGEEDSIFMEIPNPKAKKTINVEIQDLNSPNPNSNQSRLPYPERMKVRGHDKPSAQYSRFLKMFKQLRLEIGLKDALVEMPKFNKWLSSLLRNKEKLEEIAITTVNAECSAIIMNKVPEKLEDPGKFLIPCALQELKRTSALADSGASINLLPHSIYKKLGLEALTPTRMTLELANRSISHPMGIAEDVVVRVDGFTFLADFVVVNFEPDPRVPIILGRPFLRTAKALIDLYEEKLTLRVGKDELVYYADKSEKNKDKNCVHAISIIDFSKEDPFSGSTTNSLHPSSSPVKTSDNIEKFTDELAPLDSLPSGNDDSTLKKEFHEVNFQVYSNPLFEFDESFKSSNVNPLFEENNKDVEIKSSSSSTLTSPEASELEDYLEKDSIPPGIDLTLPTTLEVLSSNPTFPTLTKEKVCAWETPMFFSLVRFVWKMMTRIAIRKKIMCRPVETPLAENTTLNHVESEDDKLLSDIGNYQKLVGKLIYLTNTRPDISYAVHCLSQFMHAPLSSHLEAAFRVLRYLKNSPGSGIQINKVGNLKLRAYADSDWARCPATRKSVSGYCVFLGSSLITWKSKKQSTLSRSSAEAEYRSMASATCEVIWLSNLLGDMGVKNLLPVVLYCDNSSALQIAANPVFHEKSKHFEIDVHLVREKVASGVIVTEKIHTSQQIADVLTKALGSKQHDELCTKIGILDMFKVPQVDKT